MIATATEIDRWMSRLFDIPRSVTGEGNRVTLRALEEIVPLRIREVPSGTRVYDWTVPDEWTIRDAWIAAPGGRRIVDFGRSNLHVVSYSEPVRAGFSWDELRPRLHRHPNLPDAIPYRTSYYRRTWGFCVTAAQYAELEQLGGPFEVVIDADLSPGSLSYGELLIPGTSAQEILISCYICHPAMANDSLSGVIAAAMLGRDLLQRPSRRYSYRLAFVPETIGAIAYCAANEAALKRIDLGLVMTTVGGPGRIGYKQTYDASHPLNRLIEDVFRERGADFVTYPFDIHGSDERQYSSQGFGINVATICRDRYYEYPQYHSSLDDLTFVTGRQIAETLDLYRALIGKLEAREILRTTQPHCEVMLGRHGLYPAEGGALRPEQGGRSELDLILWLLFLCDGRLAVDDIARQLDVPLDRLAPVAAKLTGKGLLARV